MSAKGGISLGIVLLHRHAPQGWNPVLHKLDESSLVPITKKLSESQNMRVQVLHVNSFT